METKLIEIPEQPIEILKVQPHNYALAKDTLDYIIGATRQEDRYFRESPVIHIIKNIDGTYFTEDGDHRLHHFHIQGNKFYDYAKIYDLSTPRGALALAQFRREKYEIDILGKNPSANLIDEFNKQFPIASASDIKLDYIDRMIKFVQLKGVYNTSDLKGKIRPTKENLKDEFDTIYRGFLKGFEL